MHAHNVYFALKDKSAPKIDELIADSKKYLAPIDGIVSFECGILESDCKRVVNDLNFDVSLHVLFRDQAAHDAYQISAPHEEYVSRNKANWASARVFDSRVR